MVSEKTGFFLDFFQLMRLWEQMIPGAWPMALLAGLSWTEYTSCMGLMVLEVFFL